MSAETTRSGTREYVPPTCTKCGHMIFPLALMPLVSGPTVCYCDDPVPPWKAV